MRVKAIGYKIVVKPDEAKTETAGGILLPDAAKERPLEGEVVDVGPGPHPNGSPMECQVGDRVLYGRYVGSPIEVDGVEYIVMYDFDPLCKKVPVAQPDGVQ